jgi:hypothetical protein
MSESTASLAVALVLLAGCSSGALDEADESARPTSAWIEAGATAFGSDGETGEVTIAAQEPCAAIAVRATTAPGVCFQPSLIADGEGRAVVDGRSRGAYCRDCAMRESVAISAGVFVLPAESHRFEPESGLSLRFARVDCETLTPLAAPADRPALRVAVQRIEAIPNSATIDLRFLVASSSILFGDEDRRSELVAQLSNELASAGLVPRLVDVRELDAMPTELRFHAGDSAALAAAIAKAPPKADTTVDVVFGACLLYDDPIVGPPRPVDGYTPRIPGGAGPADAVFLPGLDCFAEGSGPVDLPARAAAHVLAHELGHYLGLYHTVEEDGREDQLDDTGPDDIMFFHPQQADAVGFSASQGRVVRTHPAARAR